MDYSTGLLIDAALDSSYGILVFIFLFIYFIIGLFALVGFLFALETADFSFFIVPALVLAVFFPRLGMMEYMTVKQKYANVIFQHLYEEKINDMNTEYIVQNFVYEPHYNGNFRTDYKNFLVKLSAMIPNNVVIDKDVIVQKMLPEVKSCMKVSSNVKPDRNIEKMEEQIESITSSCMKTASEKILDVATVKSMINDFDTK